MRYFFGCTCFSLILFAMTISSVFAATGSPELPGARGAVEVSNPVTIDNPIKAKSIQGLFEVILDIILVFAVPIIVFFIMFAGFKYVMAQGNSEAISEANKMLLFALIGGVLILGANVLIDVIQGTVDSITK